MATMHAPAMRPRLAVPLPGQPRPALAQRPLQLEASRRPCFARPAPARCAAQRAGGRPAPAEEQEAPSTSGSPAAEQAPRGSGPSAFAAGLRKLGKAVAVGALCAALALSSASPALAARSGGRMGGSSFGSSAGRMSSGGGFGGSSFGGSRMGGPSLDASRLGGRMGGYTAPSYRSPTLAPRGGMSLQSFGWFGPPVFYGGGYGYGYGVPVGGGGGGFGTILLLGIAAAILWSIFSSRSEEEVYYDDGYTDESMARVTVAKLQVGLLGSAGRRLQRDLERIADKADTDSPGGLHYILQETVLALLRNPELFVYGASESSRRTGLQAGEARFNEFSMQERSKFKQETLVNVGGRRRAAAYQRTSAGQKEVSELIVVTILVALEGGLSLPQMSSLEDMRASLSKLGGVSADQTLAVEVLWTPQDDDDYYTKDEIFQDYPTLIPL